MSRLKLYCPAVKRVAEVSRLQDLNRVLPENRWHGTPPQSLKPQWDWSPISAPYPQHSGVDIMGDRGDPIYAVFGGRVWVGTDAWGGRYPLIITESGIEDTYAHMDEIWVKTGDTVKAGQQIGVMGDTGNARGVHLHFHSFRQGVHHDAYPRLFGLVDAWGRDIAPVPDTYDIDQDEYMADGDYYTTIELPVMKAPNIAEKVGTIPANSRIITDKRCDPAGGALLGQLWARLAGQSWNWICLHDGDAWQVMSYKQAIERGLVGRTHTITSGDTLWKLAADYLGDGMRFKEIEILNPGIQPLMLRPGQLLQIPTE
ncbi:MAG: peptidoglycan DD-metalloendopeptidase family protein [Bacillota bacterium]|nr:peptidoglycan DD-metalloendopeptidase family protein [Bacillota bacterium]